mmetsp:Transcript_11445/g.17588  ORF Transcript_11445/g.17588 Transcript_11445/m.17588 type:complete len:238 (-) Transcript_11445:118-831(-)
MDKKNLPLGGGEEVGFDLAVIKNPKPADVLCGRGKMAFDHIGNDCFRVLISRAVDAYQAAPTKKSKTDVIHQIVDTVYARGGRFLINKNGQWIDGGIEQGKKKTGYALRDAARGRVKCIFEPASNLKSGNQQPSIQTSPNDIRSASTSFAVDFPSVDMVKHPFNLLCDTMPARRPKTEAEPERDWRNSELDKHLADDLVDFFIDEKGEPVSDPEAKSRSSPENEVWRNKPLHRSSTI